MPIGSGDPIAPFLAQQGFVVLDGGLATELETRGCDLADDLWSARVLREDPDAIRAVHREYLRAGADCVVSSSYQATFDGFARRGCSEAEGADLLRLSVQLVREERDEFWSEPRNRPDRLRPIVAASVGPYGAFLADGSEYTGAYAIGESELYEFHRGRWHALVRSGPDLMACETIPSYSEVRALARLLEESGGMPAWVSLSCGDALHLRDGSLLAGAVARVADLDAVVAVGANCISPALVPDLIRTLRGLTGKPIAVYPNSGEDWDARDKRWVGAAGGDLADAARGWFRLGARLIGGCCRTGPADIARIRESLMRSR